MIKWLSEKYDAKIVTVTVDVGQREDLNEIEERAYHAGAQKHVSFDCKKEFYEDYVKKAIKANALYQGEYPLSTALARPLIAKKLVQVAREEGADAVAHGCTGKGNDQIRFEVSIKALDPKLRVYAPVRDWGLTRDAEIEYAKKKGLNINPKSKVYSVDQNLWGRSIEGGVLEDLSQAVPKDALEWVVPLEETPDEPAFVTVKFKQGVPVALNDLTDGVQIVRFLNTLAGKHGFGLVDHVEDRVVGIKSREVYEVPAALALIKAHRELEKLTLNTHQLRLKPFLEAEWARLVYSGLWFDPLRENLDAFIESTQKAVEGEVELKLFKGSCSVVSRKSPNSLYKLSLATYSSESSFDQSLAKGFTEIWGLPTILSTLKVDGA